MARLFGGRETPKTWLVSPPPSLPARPAIPVLPAHLAQPDPPAPAPVVLRVGAVMISPGHLLAGMQPAADDVPNVPPWVAGLTAAFARVPGFSLLGACCVLGIVKQETGRLDRWDEVLRYKDPARILAVHGGRAVRTPSARAAVASHKAGTPWPALALAEAGEIVGNPVALGYRVYAAWGGYAARGLGGVQLTTLAGHQAFADWLGMSLADARALMATIPGAALTAPWYVWHHGGQAAANRGDMRAIIGLVVGKKPGPDLDRVWGVIEGEARMEHFRTFRRVLGA